MMLLTNFYIFLDTVIFQSGNTLALSDLNVSVCVCVCLSVCVCVCETFRRVG